MSRKAAARNSRLVEKPAPRYHSLPQLIDGPYIWLDTTFVKSATSSAPATPGMAEIAPALAVAAEVMFTPVGVLVVLKVALALAEGGKAVVSDTVRQKNRSQIDTCRAPAVT